MHRLKRADMRLRYNCNLSVMSLCVRTTGNFHLIRNVKEATPACKDAFRIKLKYSIFEIIS